MMNKSNKIKFLSLVMAAAAFMLASGSSARVSAQRDPFAKPGGGAPRSSGGTTRSSSTTSSAPKAAKPKPSAPVPVSAPGIQDRIAYYKRLREAAAIANQPIPKVTSVLTLDEMSIVGIFRTPRGYAAMVEAKPIKLSYTIYPGEKFFDGQLVAIEENRLVFRKVTKMTDGKFIAAEENKTLREYTVTQEVQGTAPVEPSGKTETAANTEPASSADPTDDKAKAKVPVIVSSPLEEMIKKSAEPSTDSAKDKPSKKGKARASSRKKTPAKPENIAENKDH
ncbi:MAG: hypothetical protein ACR2L1_10270 [Pyrinomonadaceae bacterium]